MTNKEKFLALVSEEDYDLQDSIKKRREKIIRGSLEVSIASIQDTIELDKGGLFKVTNLSEINKLKEHAKEREAEIFHKMVEKRSDE
jgi:hypothetical protein